MKTIKFRVWNTSLKRFEDLSNFWVRPNDFSTCFMEWRPDFDGEMVFETKETDFIYQQFTGLYDNQNREIYEGDFLSLTDLDQKRRVGIVAFDEYSAAFCVDLVGGGVIWPVQMKTNSFEVVGNIFQNSELLS